MSKGAKSNKKVGVKKPKAEKKKVEVTKRGKLIKGNKTRKTFNSSIKKVSAKSYKSGISSKSLKVMNSFCQDMLDRIASAAAGVARASGKQTITAAAAQAAVRMVLPADLAKHSASEASKAAAAFAKATPKKASGSKKSKTASSPKKSQK